MQKVIAVVGPTGVGKTLLSLSIAKKYNGEIINGDSMQMYKDMNIGTAKIKEEEMEGISHHLFSFLDISKTNSIYDYQKLVRNKIDEVSKWGKVPILVGGTGLYLKACLYDYCFLENENKLNIEDKYASYSNEELYELLKKVDSEAASKIHYNNKRRVLRALEIYETSGEKKSEIESKQEHKLVYDALVIGLTMERKLLHSLQDQRVEKMFEEGLEKEVFELFENPDFLNSSAIKAIGYKEFIPYKDNLISLEEVKEQIKIHTHQYTKRQFTFFRNKFEVNWFEANVNNFNETIKLVNNIIDGFIY